MKKMVENNNKNNNSVSNYELGLANLLTVVTTATAAGITIESVSSSPLRKLLYHLCQQQIDY